MDRAKVQDLTRKISVPRPQIYVALGSLMNRGLVRENRGKVSYYAAVEPVIAFRSTLRQEELALKAKIEGIRKLNEEHKRVEKEEVPAHFVQVLKGAQVTHFIDALAAGANEEVLIFLKSAQQQSEKSLEGAARSEIGLMQRGVRVRCLYEAAALEETRILPILSRLVEHGEDGRVVPLVPMDMMVFDRQSALFSLSTQQGDSTVFVFNHPDLITTMRNSFQYLWEQGASLKDALKQGDRIGQ